MAGPANHQDAAEAAQIAAAEEKQAAKERRKQQKLELAAEKKARLDKIALRMAEVVAGSKKKIEDQAAKRAAGSLHLPPLMMCTYGVCAL